MKKLALAVMISGTGSNLKAIIEAVKSGTLHADIRLVVSSRPEAKGIRYAKEAGIPLLIMQKSEYKNPQEADQKISEALKQAGVELVAMAGYMRKVTEPLLSAYPDKIINLHPALLPSFRGAHAIQEAFDFGVKVTGVTVHIINEEYDQGKIIAQEPLKVDPTWSIDELERHIHDLEHRLYPQVIESIAQGALSE